MLYNLANDLSEKTNRIKNETERVDELRKLLLDWESKMAKPKPRAGLNGEEKLFFKDMLE